MVKNQKMALMIVIKMINKKLRTEKFLRTIEWTKKILSAKKILLRKKSLYVLWVNLMKLYGQTM